MAASCLKFFSLFLSVWLVSYLFSTVKSLFMGPLRIVLVFCIFQYCSFILESLLGKIDVTMAILQKYLGILSS